MLLLFQISMVRVLSSEREILFLTLFTYKRRDLPSKTLFIEAFEYKSKPD